MLRRTCSCNGIGTISENLLGQVREVLLGVYRYADSKTENITQLIDTGDSIYSLDIASSYGGVDQVVPPCGCLPQLNTRRKTQTIPEFRVSNRHTLGISQPLVGIMPQFGSKASPWPCVSTSPQGHLRSQRSRFYDEAQPSIYQVRYMQTWRRENADRDMERVDGEYDDGARSASSDRLRRSQKLGDSKTLRENPSDDDWGEKIVGGGSSTFYQPPSTRPGSRNDQWHGDRGRRDARGGRNSGDGGRDGGNSSQTYPYTAYGIRRRLPQAPEGRAAATEHHQQQRQLQEKRQRQQQLEAGTKALGRLRMARSLRELERTLDTTPTNLLSPRHIATAVVSYSKLLNGAQSATSATAGMTRADFHRDHDSEKFNAAAARTAASGSALEPPPIELRERLRAELLQAAPALGLRELSYCLYGLSMLPKAHNFLGRDELGQDLNDALLSRLEVNLYNLAEVLKKPNSKVHRRQSGGGGVSEGGVVGEGEGEFGLEVHCLTYSCTAVRRLQIVRPSVYRALAAAAAPLLGRELSGDSLPPLVIGFLEAGNPEPLFMEQLVHQSSLPYSLARTSSVFAATVLLRAAGLTGAEPAVVQPLAARLTELLKKSNMVKSSTATAGNELAAVAAAAHGSDGAEVQTAAAAAAAAEEEEEEEDGTEEAGARGGGGTTSLKASSSSSSSRTSSSPQQQQQQSRQPGSRIRPSADDFQVTFILQACASAGLGPDSDLVQILLEQVRRRQSKWDLLHKLMTARHLNALGVDVIEALQQPVAAATGPAAAAPALHRDQQQTLAEVATLALLREQEVLQFLQTPGITLSSLLHVLYGLSQLRTRPRPPIGGGGGGGGAAAALAEGDFEEAAPAVSASAAAIVASSHPNRMPSALGVAIQLTNAAAPLMAPRQATLALSSILAAGVAAPPMILQRAEQLYKDSLTGSGGAAITVATSYAAGGGQGSGGRSLNGVTDLIQASANTGTAAGIRGLTATETAGAGDYSGVRDVGSLCAMVGRVLAWQPAAAAAAMLSDEFVQHCRQAALSASRDGKRFG